MPLDDKINNYISLRLSKKILISIIPFSLAPIEAVDT